MTAYIPRYYCDATVSWAVVPVAFGVAITGMTLFLRMLSYTRR